MIISTATGWKQSLSTVYIFSMSKNCDLPHLYSVIVPQLTNRLYNYFGGNGGKPNRENVPVMKPLSCSTYCHLWYHCFTLASLAGVRPGLRALPVRVAGRLCDYRPSTAFLGMVRVRRCVHAVQISRETLVLHSAGGHLHDVVRFDAGPRPHRDVRHPQLDSWKERFLRRGANHGICPCNFPCKSPSFCVSKLCIHYLTVIYNFFTIIAWAHGPTYIEQMAQDRMASVWFPTTVTGLWFGLEPWQTTL